MPTSSVSLSLYVRRDWQDRDRLVWWARKRWWSLASGERSRDVAHGTFSSPLDDLDDATLLREVCLAVLVALEGETDAPA